MAAQAGVVAETTGTQRGLRFSGARWIYGSRLVHLHKGGGWLADLKVECKCDRSMDARIRGCGSLILFFFQKIK